MVPLRRRRSERGPDEELGVEALDAGAGVAEEEGVAGRRVEGVFAGAWLGSGFEEGVVHRSIPGLQQLWRCGDALAADEMFCLLHKLLHNAHGTPHLVQLSSSLAPLSPRRRQSLDHAQLAVLSVVRLPHHSFLHMRLLSHEPGLQQSPLPQRRQSTALDNGLNAASEGLGLLERGVVGPTASVRFCHGFAEGAQRLCRADLGVLAAREGVDESERGCEVVEVHRTHRVRRDMHTRHGGGG
mmetsp:Transcript_37197/g.80578  ORF Transcript_37197/g.80578 Transcript_37197/m.80578 type:complete len:241 (+) Transcript_37197:1137-1859(+)